MKNTCTETEVVFVQLGNHRALHVKPNVIRLLKLFPGIKVNLIVDNHSIKNFKGLKNVQFYLYRPPQKIEMLFNSNQHDQTFRSGFWRYSLERIFAIGEFHTSRPDVKILHFESDVLALPNFPFTKFEGLNGLAWCTFNESKDVASLLFSPKIEDTQWLVARVEEEMRCNLRATDMTVLSSISKENPEKISILPSIPNLSNSKLINQKSKIHASDYNQLSSGFNVFGGVFDSAPIGMWLLGQDPRNHFGKLIIHTTSFIDTGDSFVNPAAVKYRINHKGELIIDDGESYYPVFCLHVHSKELKLFSSNWFKSLSMYVELTNNKKSIKFLKLGILFNIFIELLMSKSLIRFILSEPTMYRILSKIQKLLMQR